MPLLLIPTLKGREARKCAKLLVKCGPHQYPQNDQAVQLTRKKSIPALPSHPQSFPGGPLPLCPLFCHPLPSPHTIQENRVLFATPPFSPEAAEQIINHCSLHLQQPLDGLEKGSPLVCCCRVFFSMYVLANISIPRHTHTTPHHTPQNKSTSVYFCTQYCIRNNERDIEVGTFISFFPVTTNNKPLIHFPFFPKQ